MYFMDTSQNDLHKMQLKPFYSSQGIKHFQPKSAIFLICDIFLLLNSAFVPWLLPTSTQHISVEVIISFKLRMSRSRYTWLIDWLIDWLIFFQVFLERAHPAFLIT